MRDETKIIAVLSRCQTALKAEFSELIEADAPPAMLRHFVEALANFNYAIHELTDCRDREISIVKEYDAAYDAAIDRASERIRESTRQDFLELSGAINERLASIDAVLKELRPPTPLQSKCVVVDNVCQNTRVTALDNATGDYKIYWVDEKGQYNLLDYYRRLRNYPPSEVEIAALANVNFFALEDFELERIGYKRTMQHGRPVDDYLPVPVENWLD